MGGQLWTGDLQLPARGGERVIKSVPEGRHVQTAWHAVQQVIETQAGHWTVLHVQQGGHVLTRRPAEHRIVQAQTVRQCGDQAVVGPRLTLRR
jgi:tellurite resistance-related uncharacterized protein